jgi:hypothetical protein
MGAVRGAPRLLLFSFFQPYPMRVPAVLFSLALWLLSGSVAAQDAGVIDRVQMGDNELDCAQIARQVEALDAILAPHSGDKGAVRGATESATRSRTGEVVAGVAKALPFGSVFGDIAKDVLGRRGRDAEARLASARARKEYLVDMFLKRGCRMADVTQAQAKPVPEAGSPAPSVATPVVEAPDASANKPAEPQTTAPAPDAALPPEAGTPSAAAGEGASVVKAKPAEATSPQPAAVDKAAAKSPPPAEPAASPRGPLFVLDFRLAFRTSADADGAAGAPGLELGGVPLTTMQAITDAAYQALLQDLAGAGFEVLNPELIEPVSRTGSLPAPARAGDYLYFAPSGTPLAQAPEALQPGSDAALGETRAALAQAVGGRKPGVSYAIGVWYVDFARLRGEEGTDQPRRLETRLAMAAGSHLAVVEPASGDDTPPDAVHVFNLGRDLVTREPYGQVRLPSGTDALELQADPQRFTVLVERQLKRGRSALIASLPPAPAVQSDVAEPAPAN